jgi:sterol 3beta-glucosyltransferase
MRTLILTVGTRGDVQPHVALARGLIAAGHDVALCTSTQFEPFVSSYGVQYVPLNNDLVEFIRSDDGKIAMETSEDPWQAARTAVRLLPKMGGMLQRQVADAWNSTQQFRPDLIIFHPKALAAKDFAEKLGIPCVLAFYLPMFVPTAEFPAMGFPQWKIGRQYNRLTYRVIESQQSS